jgi:hypothetical protein
MFFYTRLSSAEVDDAIVDGAIQESFEQDKTAMLHARVLGASSLVDFFHAIGRRDNFSLKRLALRFALRILPQLKTFAKVHGLLEALGRFDEASAVVAATDLSDAGLGESSPPRQELLEYIESLPATTPLLDRLRGLFFVAVKRLPDAFLALRLFLCMAKAHPGCLGDAVHEEVTRLFLEKIALVQPDIPRDRQRACADACSMVPLFYLAREVAPNRDAFLRDERTVRSVFSRPVDLMYVGLYAAHGEAVDAFLTSHPSVCETGNSALTCLVIRYPEGLARWWQFQWKWSAEPDPASCIALAVAFVRRYSVDFTPHYAEFLRPPALWNTAAGRRWLLHAIAALFPHPLVMPHMDAVWRSAVGQHVTDAPDDAIGRAVLLQLYALLLAAAEAVLAGCPTRPSAPALPSQCVGLELLEALLALADALGVAERMEPVEAFLRAILPVSVPFDPHIRACLCLVGRRGCDPGLLCECLHEPPDSVVAALLPALADLCFGLRDADIPEGVAARFLGSIALPAVDCFRPLQREISALTATVAVNHGALALAHLDAALQKSTPLNLVRAVVILEVTGEKRAIANLIMGYRSWAFIAVNGLIADVLRVNNGPITDFERFTELLTYRGVSHATKRALWALFEQCLPPAPVVVKVGTTVCALEARAGYIRYAGPLSVPHARLQMAIASYKALGVLFDAVAAEEGDFFTSHGVARLIISQSCGIKKKRCLPLRISDRQKFLAQVTLARRRRRLIVEPLLRYARRVLPQIGHEAIARWLQGRMAPIERRLLFVNSVLEDPKEGGLTAEGLDPLFDEFTLIAELRPECRLD